VKSYIDIRHKVRNALLVLGTGVLTLPGFCQGETLSEGTVTEFSQRCSPSSDSGVLLAVARIESKFDPLALHDNSKGISISAPSVEVATKLANRWLSEGDSVDIGLMQINSDNLAPLGMTIEAAFDPCRSLEAGARILSAAYAQGSSTANRQAALLIALSRYNTGRTLAGLTNGYVGRVLSAQGNATKANSKPSDPGSQHSDWNIWFTASFAQHDGAAWLVGSQDLHDFLIGAGAQPEAGEPHAVSSGPGTAPGT
jgi:type IV secretion system protein VirB1